MSVTDRPTRTKLPAELPLGDAPLRFHNVDYADFAARPEGWGRGYRAVFDNGVLELMPNGPRHETWKKLLAQLVEAACRGLGLGWLGAGAWTLLRDDLEKALEPDEC
jgi:Uma2 family endonuclease